MPAAAEVVDLGRRGARGRTPRTRGSRRASGSRRAPACPCSRRPCTCGRSMRAAHHVAEEAVQLGRASAPGRSACRRGSRRSHAEVAAVLLHHHVGRDLGRAEDRVQAARRSTCPRVMPVVRTRWPGVDLAPRLELDAAAALLGAVAVHLVGGAVDERRVDAVLRASSRSRLSVPPALTSKSVNGSRAAQSCDGWAARVDRPRAMSVPYSLKSPRSAVAVADVEVDVAVAVAQLAVEPLARSRRWSLGAEEVRAHVVVDADDVQARARRSAAPPRSRSARPSR